MEDATGIGVIVRALMHWGQSQALHTFPRGESVSYSELNSRSFRIANDLLTRELAKRDELIGICMERSCDLVAATIGVMRAGAAFVPIDPLLPYDRLQHIISDSSLTCVIVEGNRTRAVIEPLALRYGFQIEDVTDLTDEAFSVYSPTRLVDNVDGDALAYCIYTSGSTGKPKGVMISQMALGQFLLAMCISPGVSTHDVMLAIATVSFDISILELLWPLLRGASVSIGSEECKRDPLLLREALHATKATILQATPATWRLLIESGWEGDFDLRALMGGEAMPIHLGNQVRERVRELWNMYGPTEATVWCSLSKITCPIDEQGASIGDAVEGTELLVLDSESLSCIMDGTVGSLFIAGPQLARGYRNLPELTSEKFVIHPTTGKRLYNTGDLAKFVLDGGRRKLYCIGRSDHQIKLNGFRIELGEVEAVLEQLSSVSCAAVALIDSTLVAFVVLADDISSSCASQKLRLSLAIKLPSYMIPGRFEFINALPLLPNGKIDRHGLRYMQSTTSNQILHHPETVLQQQLSAIACRLLPSFNGDISMNMFTIGGDSLFAVRLCAAIKRDLSLDISPSTVMQLCSIARIELEIIRLEEASRARSQRKNVVRSVGDNSDVKTVVEVQNDGTMPRLFLFHPAGGFVFPYFLLSAMLGDDFPVTAFQDIAMTSKLISPLGSVEDMAASYAKLLINYQPFGPYYLGGWSLGGQIAFEVARRLIMSGRNVGAVFVIDSAFFDSSVTDSMTAGNVMPLFRHEIDLIWKFQRAQGRKWRSRFWGLLASAIRAKNASPIEIDRIVGRGVAVCPSAAPMVQTLRAHLRASSRYRPGKFGGHVVLIQGVNGRSERALLIDREQWRAVAGTFELFEVDADHYTILEKDSASSVAQVISQVISTQWRSSNFSAHLGWISAAGFVTKPSPPVFREIAIYSSSKVRTSRIAVDPWRECMHIRRNAFPDAVKFRCQSKFSASLNDSIFISADALVADSLDKFELDITIVSGLTRIRQRIKRISSSRREFPLSMHLQELGIVRPGRYSMFLCFHEGLIDGSSFKIEIPLLVARK